MADIGDRERLFLYWLSDYTAEGISLLGLDELADVPYRHRLERDCLAAGQQYPPEGAVEAIQMLLDGGYLIAWRDDDRGKPHELTRIAGRDVDLEVVSFQLTEDGDGEALAFVDLLESEAGRRRSVEFAREFVARETRPLPFTVAVPGYMPRSFDPVPDAICYPEGGSVTLRYYEMARTGDDQIFVDETAEELGEDDEEYENEVICHDNVAGVPVTVREIQHTSQWVEVRVDWQQGGVSYRLSYHRSEGQQPDGDAEDAGTETMADISGESFDPRPRTAEIDERMRAEARKVVASMIEQAPR
jgi:hypothetical protein